MLSEENVEEVGARWDIVIGNRKPCSGDWGVRIFETLNGNPETVCRQQ
jgi:hypothetical protein